jgi:hypothetical protein
MDNDWIVFFLNFLDENSPIASPKLPRFDSTGYLSVGELSAGDDDDSHEEQPYISMPRDATRNYFYSPSDQASSSSEAPATLNDSIQNHVLSRVSRLHHRTGSLNDTCVAHNPVNVNLFQSDVDTFNFPALNAQPVRIIPSELSVVSEILSTSPPAALSSNKPIKTPSLTGDW